jgi:hypothetical protein
LAACFPLGVLMVHSSVLTISTNREHLSCDGFSLGETVRLGRLEFIANCFDNQSFSPKGSNSGAVLMGTTRIGSPALRAMIGDTTEVFYVASRREGTSGLPSSLTHGMGALPPPATTTPLLEDDPITQAMMMVPPQSDTGLPLKRRHSFWEGQRE